MLSLQIADDAAELAEDEDTLYTAGAETSAEMAELAQRMDSNELKREKLRQKQDEEDTSRSEAEEYDEQIDDLRESYGDMQEKMSKLMIDSEEIESDKRESLAAITVEQFEKRADAEMDAVSGWAAYKSYQQWNLLLSPKARVDTKPELEIIADDVRCAHGATVSQLQEDELFYLRSRGITETEATALLLRGYCQDVIDQLPVQADRWRPLEQVHQELSR